MKRKAFQRCFNVCVDDNYFLVITFNTRAYATNIPNKSVFDYKCSNYEIKFNF